MPTHESADFPLVMKTIRTFAAVAFAMVALTQVIQSAFVSAYAADNPRRAAKAWPSHPDILFKVALEDISQAAAAGRKVPTQKISEIYSAAMMSPLAPEPFLVRGVEAELAGNEKVARLAFEAARRRNPRSLAAHYFLADHYLQTGRPDEGLRELAALTRLMPGAIAAVAPYYARYAKAPGGAARMKAMLQDHPEFEDDILSLLAEDAANADLVLALSSRNSSALAEPPRWHRQLVESLLNQGEYARAREAWAKLSGWHGEVGQALFDPQFSGKKAPPPFNWTLLSTASGLAEGQSGGRLHVIYYGRDDANLASQTLTLTPGRYRIRFEVERGGGVKHLSSLAWRVSCLTSNRDALTLRLVGGLNSGEFSVTADCPAQLLKLVGESPEYPQTIDVTIKGLVLVRIA